MPARLPCDQGGHLSQQRSCGLLVQHSARLCVVALLSAVIGAGPAWGTSGQGGPRAGFPLPGISLRLSGAQQKRRRVSTERRRGDVSDHSCRGARKVLCVTGAGHCFLRARRSGLLSAARLVRVSLIGLGCDIGWYVACPTFQRLCQADTGPGGIPVVTGQCSWACGTFGVDTHGGVSCGVRGRLLPNALGRAPRVQAGVAPECVPGCRSGVGRNLGIRGYENIPVSKRSRSHGAPGNRFWFALWICESIQPCAVCRPQWKDWLLKQPRKRCPRKHLFHRSRIRL